MPDDHSKLVPLLPIPNRTVKRLSADDSAGSRVKVGHRQALIARNAPSVEGAFFSVLLNSFKKFLKSTERNAKVMLNWRASLITASDAKGSGYLLD